MTEELRIRGSMGDIYGVLTVPEGKEPVPLIILFLIFRKKIMAGVSRGGTKG